MLFLPRRQDTKDLTHLPEVAPSEFEEILIKHHTNPPAWFLGQVGRVDNIEFKYKADKRAYNLLKSLRS